MMSSAPWLLLALVGVRANSNSGSTVHLCDETVCDAGVDEGCGCLQLVPPDECPDDPFTENVWWNCKVRRRTRANFAPKK